MTHVDDSIDAVRDLETIQHELCQKDLAYLNDQEALEKKNLQALYIYIYLYLSI